MPAGVAPKGFHGKKGRSGRKSTWDEKKEVIWHDEKWKLDSDAPQLKAKLATGKYSVRDVFLAKALQGNEKILGIFANKLLADLHEVGGTGGGPLIVRWLTEGEEEEKK